MSNHFLSIFNFRKKLTLEEKLNLATNPAVTNLKDKHWRYNFATLDQDQLHHDALEFGINFFGEVFSSNSPEWKEYIKITYRKDMLEGKKKEAFKNFIKNRFPAVSSLTKFEEIYLELETAWRSSLLVFLREAIAAAVRSQGYGVEGLPELTITYKDSKWRAHLLLKDVALTKAEYLKHPIPGTVSVDFFLENYNFELDLNSFNATNPLLEKLFLRQHVEITQQLLDYEAQLHALTLAQEKINTTLTLYKGLSSNETRFDAAQEILDEVERLKNTNHQASVLQHLTRVIDSLEDLIFSVQQSPVIFNNLIKEINQFPWGKVLAGLMLGFLGLFIEAASIAGLVVSAGTAAAPASLGVVAGAGMIAGSVFLLVNSFKKNPLVEKATNYVNAHQDEYNRTVAEVTQPTLQELNIDNYSESPKIRRRY